jgi:endonuclease YncB( thermonuclease family)
MLKTVTLSLTLSLTILSATDVNNYTCPDNKILKVVDGDTITYCKDNKKQRGRLSDIDAPELKQEFGVTSKNFLSSLLSNQVVTITKDGVDYYKRNLITLEIAGENINKIMVSHGYAWSYSRSNNNEIFGLELVARENNLGLWSNPEVISPKQFRNKHK